MEINQPRQTTRQMQASLGFLITGRCVGESGLRSFEFGTFNVVVFVDHVMAFECKMYVLWESSLSALFWLHDVGGWTRRLRGEHGQPVQIRCAYTTIDEISFAFILFLHAVAKDWPACWLELSDAYILVAIDWGEFLKMGGALKNRHWQCECFMGVCEAASGDFPFHRWQQTMHSSKNWSEWSRYLTRWRHREQLAHVVCY